VAASFISAFVAVPVASPPAGAGRLSALVRSGSLKLRRIAHDPPGEGRCEFSFHPSKARQTCLRNWED